MQEAMVFASLRAVENAILWHMKNSHSQVRFDEVSGPHRLKAWPLRDEQARRAEPMIAGVRKPPESIENETRPGRGTGYATPTRLRVRGVGHCGGGVCMRTAGRPNVNQTMTVC